MRLERLLLHPAWMPLVVVATLAAVSVSLALGAAPAAAVCAGCHGPETGPPAGAAPDGRFRWTRRTAALKLPVRGPVLVVPVYLARPDIADGPIDVAIALGDLHAGSVRFTGNGWHVVAYDLVDIAGEAPWSRLRSLTVTFEVSRTVRPSAVFGSDDHRELGIGLGQPRWANQVPLGAITPATRDVPAAHLVRRSHRTTS